MKKEKNLTMVSGEMNTEDAMYNKFEKIKDNYIKPALTEGMKKISGMVNPVYDYEQKKEILENFKPSYTNEQIRLYVNPEQSAMVMSAIRRGIDCGMSMKELEMIRSVYMSLQVNIYHCVDMQMHILAKEAEAQNAMFPKEKETAVRLHTISKEAVAHAEKDIQKLMDAFGGQISKNHSKEKTNGIDTLISDARNRVSNRVSEKSDDSSNHVHSAQQLGR